MPNVDVNETVRLPTWIFKFAGWILGLLGFAAVAIVTAAFSINTRLTVIEENVKSYNKLEERVRRIEGEQNAFRNDLKALQNYTQGTKNVR